MVRDLDLLPCGVRRPACVNQGLGKSLLIIRFQEIVNSVHFKCMNGVHIVSRDKDIYGSGAVHWLHILDDSKTIQIRHLHIEKNDVRMKFIDLAANFKLPCSQAM